MSPFGRKLDTLMDESVRKSWQLAPEHVHVKNPLWQTGMEKLSETAANRLGYKGVPLQCKLYKLLVYGEGGHFVKHQDTEKEDGMIATMVVQLPSLHEGGDLVVYQRGQEKHRHDFGKKDGTAAYLPHYAVHYADAEHALEKVTKGFRLVLICSICLPSIMQGLERNPDKSKSEELASAISCMGPDEKCFSLLLSHEYTEKSITSMGSDALKGIDRARVEALMEASCLAGSAKALQFFFAELTHDASFYDAGGQWEEDEHKESITWYSFSGKKFGATSRAVFNLNFLNPDQDSLAAIWEECGESTFEGYLGNEGATRNTTYRRYAIVGWPVALGVENALEFINTRAAIEVLQAKRPVAPETLRTFINAAGDKLKEAQEKCSRENVYAYTEPRKVTVSGEFSQALCELLVEADDLSLIDLFFTKVCSNVGNKDDLIPVIIALTRKYNWSDIGAAVLSSLQEKTETTTYAFGRMREVGDSTMIVTLRILEGLDDGPAKQALLKSALNHAMNLRHGRLCTSKALGSLWNSTIRSGDSDVIETLVIKFKEMDPALLGPLSDVFTHHFGDLDSQTRSLLCWHQSPQLGSSG
ncbi:unnamed protein product [Phytophthora fragariaefolia]|uniref:Unnamed protein product n=1 Tax=Phytophthora fragariaefolia TaxID=1490495 RepID=A0A9W6Y378_9STRA|nr:unnamed protein product [Phytophthora fragariaefolia]